MVQGVQPALYALLNHTDITSLLGTASGDSIRAVTDIDGDTVMPCVILEYAGGRKVNLTNLYQDWRVYALDRDNGFYRIAGILDEVKKKLDEKTLALSGQEKCFEIEWLNDVPWTTSRAFRAEIGGALFRIYLSTA